ncbi:hypothetical protein GCM10010913_24110 [Paenibacillus aceti]|uniref:Uncharacterized protein n=1 Tax=Paenibacillus aceti TaxID=1820010 RepID=A0ABQ1VVM7_9BACL|nr:hypothetical protein GCM10010913_24110 [Paenibacillus aceti]
MLCSLICIMKSIMIISWGFDRTFLDKRGNIDCKLKLKTVNKTKVKSIN